MKNNFKNDLKESTDSFISKVFCEVSPAKKEFDITHTFNPEEFAPGVWCGTEGLEFKIVSVDLENRTIKLELKVSNEK